MRIFKIIFYNRNGFVLEVLGFIGIRSSTNNADQRPVEKTGKEISTDKLQRKRKYIDKPTRKLSGETKEAI